MTNIPYSAGNILKRLCTKRLHIQKINGIGQNGRMVAAAKECLRDDFSFSFRTMGISSAWDNQNKRVQLLILMKISVQVWLKSKRMRVMIFTILP